MVKEVPRWFFSSGENFHDGLRLRENSYDSLLDVGSSMATAVASEENDNG